MLEILKKVLLSTSALILLSGFFSLSPGQTYVSAATTKKAPTVGCDADQCGNVDPATQPCTNDRCDFIGKYVNPGINLLSISFGIIAVMSLILGSIQYSASAGESQKVTQAKSRIQNTIIAIVAYFLMYAFLQFLIPGGLFNRSGPGP